MVDEVTTRDCLLRQSRNMGLVASKNTGNPVLCDMWVQPTCHSQAMHPNEQDDATDEAWKAMEEIEGRNSSA